MIQEYYYFFPGSIWLSHAYLQNRSAIVWLINFIREFTRALLAHNFFDRMAVIAVQSFMTGHLEFSGIDTH